MFILQVEKSLSHEKKYLVRIPLLDIKHQVAGYRLAWQKNVKSTLPAESDGSDLLTFVGEFARDIKISLLFLEATPSKLSAELLQALVPTTTVLIIKSTDAIDVGHIDLTKSLRKLGFGLALCDVDIAFLLANTSLLSETTHILICFDHPEFREICSYAKQRAKPLCVVVEDVPGWQELEDCAAFGAYGFFGDLCVAPRHVNHPAKLAPQTQQILHLMQMVQENADIRDLEKVLKDDVTLSYKLLRYINSAGFGLEVEIESPRHAVAMLGYEPLFRWLLLLLGRTSAEGFSPALMQAALVRGRFAELLGQGFLSRKEAENLFVVGMFSSLDRLLGIPVKEISSQLALPDSVAQTMQSPEGLYGSVLALAEASERDDGDVAILAQALGMTNTHVNQAHLSAIAWAQGIKL